MGDFNIITSENHHLKDFTDSNDFENLIKEPTCFKSIREPPLISLGKTEKATLRNLQQTEQEYQKITNSSTPF